MHDSPEGRTLARVRRSFRKLAWCLAGTARGWLWLAALAGVAGRFRGGRRSFGRFITARARRWTNSRPSTSRWSSRTTCPIRALTPGRRNAARMNCSPMYRSARSILARLFPRDLPRSVPGENRAWGSSVVDQTAPARPAFLADRIIAPLWQRGYRGFFLETGFTTT